MEDFLGEIRMFAGNFAPLGWLFCDGRTLPISQNTALFSLIGTTYGGDGRTTFALPNLNGRTPLGAGDGVAVTPRFLGEVGGTEFVTLQPHQMPGHSHVMAGRTGAAAVASPVGAMPALGEDELYVGSVSGDAATRPLGPSGGSLPHENRQPFLAVRFCIALAGIFPQRP